MTVVKYRLFWSWQTEKEERWLNEMSGKGFQLTSAEYVRYEFVVDHSRCYEYQVEFVDEMPSEEIPLHYAQILSEMNAEYVGSTNQWAYFRRDASLGGFELHPDVDSKIEQSSKLLTIASGVLLANGIVLASNVLQLLGFGLVMIIVQGIACLPLLFVIVRVNSRIRRLKKQKRALP